MPSVLVQLIAWRIIKVSSFDWVPRSGNLYSQTTKPISFWEKPFKVSCLGWLFVSYGLQWIFTSMALYRMTPDNLFFKHIRPPTSKYGHKHIFGIISFIECGSNSWKWHCLSLMRACNVFHYSKIIIIYQNTSFFILNECWYLMLCCCWLLMEPH